MQRGQRTVGGNLINRAKTVRSETFSARKFVMLDLAPRFQRAGFSNFNALPGKIEPF